VTSLATTAIDFWLYGVPETYLIDRSGTVRWSGLALTEDISASRAQADVQVLREPKPPVVLLCAFLAPRPRGERSAELLPDRAQAQRAEALVTNSAGLVLPERESRGIQRRLAATSAASSARHRDWRQRTAGTDGMGARYGDFVRLRPPFNTVVTLALWAAPGTRSGRHQRGVIGAATAGKSQPEPLSEAERQRLAICLKS